MFGQIACELSEVGSCLHILCRPAKARRHVTLADKADDLCKIVRVHAAQEPFGNLERDLPFAERDKLLKRGERVAHATLGTVRDEIERLPLELHVLAHTDSAKARYNGLGRNAAEVESLAARVDGLGHLLGIRRGQDEHHMARRLLERLQQRVERSRRQHVNLVDDIHLVPAARGRELHTADNLFAHVLHAGTTCSIQLVDVGVLAVGNHHAVVTGSVRLRRGSVLAQKRLCQQARRGGLARAARTGEQISMAYLILLNGVFDRALNALLADDVLEDLRPVFSVQCL